MSKYKLRPYQEEAVEKGIWAANSFENNSLLVLPTAAGKSLIVSGIAEKLDKEVLVLQPSREILEQNAYKMSMYVDEDEIGVYSASFKRKDIRKYTFATIQSVYKVPELFKDFGFLIVDECFSGETEVLTENGFVRFDQLTKNEKVAQWEEGLISFVQPLRYVKRHHEGEMGLLHLWRGVKCPITLGHNQPLIHKKLPSGKNLITKPISDCKFNSDKDIIISGKSCYDSEKLSYLERMYIITQADGKIHRTSKDHVTVAFSFSKQRKINRFLDIVSRSGLEMSETKTYYFEGNVKPQRTFMVKMPKGTTKILHNHIPFPMSSEKACEIIEEMVHWDGHKRNDSNYYYSSTDKSQTDFYFQVAVLAGCMAYQATQTDQRKSTYKTVHRLYVTKNKETRTAQALKLERTEYTGTVYCVSVPSGKIIIKHKGVSLVTGNCDLINPKNQKGMFTSFIKAIGSPPMIGLTATPFRNVNGMSYNDDGQLISGTTLKLVNRMNPRMWNRIAYNIGYKELTEQGYLSEMLYSSRTIIDPKSIPVNASRSDYNLEEYTKMLTPYEQNILETISEAKKHRKHILVFCSSVSQAKRMASATRGAGWVSGDMSINDRNDTITKFRNGEIQVVFNCSVLTVGFDFPSLDCIFLLRPTKSLRLYMQMVGRGLRLAEGKTNCVVIDYTGTYDKFGDLNKIKLDKNEKGLWELYANGKPQHGKVLFEWAIDTAPKSSIII